MWERKSNESDFWLKGQRTGQQHLVHITIMILLKYSYEQVWENSVDPDQTAPSVWSGFTLFAILSAFLTIKCMIKTTLFKR